MPEANEKMTVRRVTGRVSIIDLWGQLSSFAEHALTEACTRASMPTAHNVILTVSGLSLRSSFAHRQKQRVMAEAKEGRMQNSIRGWLTPRKVAYQNSSASGAAYGETMPLALPR
jgi:hypothetical protein